MSEMKRRSLGGLLSTFPSSKIRGQGGIVLSREVLDYLEGASLVIDPLPQVKFHHYFSSDAEAYVSDWFNVTADLSEGCRKILLYYSKVGDVTVKSRHAGQSKTRLEEKETA